MLTLSLQGKKAAVTGARSGMGKAICLLFAESGADVSLADIIIDDGQLEAVAKEIKSKGCRAFAVQTDVSQRIDVYRFIERTVKEFGAIDIMVNCAGMVSTSAMVDMPEDEWDKTIDTDLKSIYLGSQAAARYMVPRKTGSIVNIASQLGLRGMVNRGAYCAAKAGVVNLTRVLGIELAKDNVRVNGIAPGTIKTPLSWRRWSDPQLLRETVAKIPMGRMGTPEEIASAALFLASDAASFITGQTLLVDGAESA
jgi:NAD(P)-dependent dehydrogenase (short-subunit alcohol dehydrogenase family)